MLLKNARTPRVRVRVKGTQESLMVSEASQEKLLSKRRERAEPSLKMWKRKTFQYSSITIYQTSSLYWIKRTLFYRSWMREIHWRSGVLTWKSSQLPDLGVERYLS